MAQMMAVTEAGVPYNAMIYQSLPPQIGKYQLEHIHDSRVKDILVSSSLCLSIATIATVLRFLSRRMVRAGCGADDWVMLGSLVLVFAYMAAIFLGKEVVPVPYPRLTIAFEGVYQYGGGGHAILLTDPVRFSQSVHAAEALYTLSIATVKISTCLLFRRIFPGKAFHRFLLLVSVFISIYSVITILASIFQCRPIAGAWDPRIKATCINIELLFEIMGGMNVLTDLALLLAPLPQLWKLQICRRQKIQVMGIFCIGGFVTIVSAYRIVKLDGIDVTDAPWTIADPSLWSLVETCVAIACACAITYRPLFNKVFNIKSSTYASEQYKTPQAASAPNARLRSDNSIGLNKISVLPNKNWSHLSGFDDTEPVLKSKGPTTTVTEV